jgi:hypothetical protein
MVHKPNFAFQIGLDPSGCPGDEPFIGAILTEVASAIEWARRMSR